MKSDDVRTFAKLLNQIADEMDAARLEYKTGDARASIDRMVMSVPGDLRMMTVPTGVHHVTVAANFELHTPANVGGKP